MAAVCLWTVGPHAQIPARSDYRSHQLLESGWLTTLSEQPDDRIANFPTPEFDDSPWKRLLTLRERSF